MTKLLEMVNMTKERKRLIYFVCSSLNQGNLVSELILADDLDKATDLFISKIGVKPDIVYGPFYKKKVEKVVLSTPFKVTNQVKKAEYESWLVNAIILKEPINSALLIFLNRLDSKKVTCPKGTFIVPISDLRFIDE